VSYLVAVARNEMIDVPNAPEHNRLRRPKQTPCRMDAQR
jgi:hypothetical protein